MAYKLSPTSLGLMKECPRCFWLHHNKGIRRPDGIFPSLPSGMDRILKDHFDYFRDRALMPPELKELGDSVKLFEDNELLDIWRNNKKGLQFVDLKGNLLRGAVDNILVKDKTLIVLDYKTRGYELKEDTHLYYQDQLDTYNFLLRRNDYQTEDYAYLLFYYPNKVSQNGDVLFHTKLVKMKVDANNAHRVFNNAINLLEGQMPESSKDCGFCGWVNNCKDI